MIGVVLVLLAMFVVGPIGLFVVAAIWSGIFGWLVGTDADEQAEAQPSTS